MGVTEEIEGWGEGSITLDRLPAQMRRLVSVCRGFMSALLVTPQRVPLSVRTSPGLLASLVNVGGAGGWIVRTEGRGDELRVSLSGWAEILSSSDGQTDWGYPISFTTEAHTLAGWQNILTGGGLIARNGLATPGPAAMASYAVDDDRTRTRIEKAAVLAAVFDTSWRVRLDSADAFPVLDFAPLDVLAGGSQIRALIDPNLPTGEASGVRVIGGSAEVVDDGADFITTATARSAEGSTLAEYLSSRAMTASTAAGNVPFRHPFGSMLGRGVRVDTTVKLNDPSHPPGDSTTQAALTAIARAEIARFGKLPRRATINVDATDVGVIPLGSRVWAHFPELGIADPANAVTVGSSSVAPIEMRVTARTIPITTHAGVYLWSMHTDTFGEVHDLTDWVVPDDDGAITVAPVIGRTRISTDITGRAHRG